MNKGETYNGGRMEPPTVKPGSVARARMLAEEKQRSAMQGSELLPIAESQATSALRNPKPRALTPQRVGGAGKMISRPSPIPHFSTSKILSSTSSTPASRPAQAPQRPPRPSRIPSMVDQSRLQEPTPLFIAPANTATGSSDSSYGQSSTDRQTVSSQPRPNVEHRSDLPLRNAVNTTNQQKKGVGLGPPPSSRRGATSFYSNASLVSPIMEESLNSRSHNSYASSAAMPENWTPTTNHNRNVNTYTFYDDSITNGNPDSMYDEYGDESRLVNTSALDSAPAVPSATRLSVSADKDIERSRTDTSNPLRGAQGNSTSATEIVHAYTTASSNGPSRVQTAQNPPGYSLAMSRGLQIDMNAIRKAESRGSLTSLPDLILRATKLASMIEKGNRPASRLDNVTEYLSEKQTDKFDGDNLDGRPSSGLSDMLASFPPVVPPPPNNGANRLSRFGQGGWPFASSSNKNTQQKNTQKGTSNRRCCGLPLWAAILAAILLLCIVVAAILVPLEVLVFRKSDSAKGNNNSINSCKNGLTCQNGGTSVISNGTCACICTGGFTGTDCGISESFDCTTTDLVSIDGSKTIQNATLGRSIPRLLTESNSNFSVPLSGSSILAKMNANGLSCTAQNSLVVFNGQSSPSLNANLKQSRYSGPRRKAHIANEAMETNAELTKPQLLSPETEVNRLYDRASDDVSFLFTDKTFDFCRIAVLFVLQEHSVDDAKATQTNIQSFLNKVAEEKSGNGSKTFQNNAANVTIGNFGSIDLVRLNIDLGKGLVGQGVMTT